jgi:multidrug resistance efflux pump
LLTIFSILFVAALFLPWTQNIRADGRVTTLTPDQRPQVVQSVIGGQIVQWYVREGALVQAGDTILRLTETKDEYFDTNLLARTRTQVQAKEMSVVSYQTKVNALENQMDAMRQTAALKMEQARNKLQQARLKVKSDSIDLQAAETNANVARLQYERNQDLYEQDLKSLTDLENRRVKYQEAQAKLISAENKLLASRNDVLNAQVELTAIQAELRDDLAKAASEQASALSSQLDVEADVAKLENQFSNYQRRTDLYAVLAPQTGYVTQILSAGIGENLKAGEEILTIMPEDYLLAVEIYVRPIDIPLLEPGQEVNILFDGWPAIVFSGWPNTSYGTYRGNVVAIDRIINERGEYRVMVAPDPDDEPWPDALQVGAGADALILLNDVPVWYELWRKINGFPADLYVETEEKGDKGPPKIKLPK